MKKRWIGVFLTLLAAILALTACSTDINNGEIDGIDELPVAVEVTGLEDVTGKAEVNLLTAAEQTEALAAVKDVYYVADGAEAYAVDIKIMDEDGKEITVGKPVTVSIVLPNAKLPLDQYVVFHIHDGKADEIVPIVEDGKLTFTVDSFSPFVVVPAHVHAYGEWAFVGEEPACGETGLQKRICVCGEEQTRDYTVDHVDENNDGTCDKCGTSLDGNGTTDPEGTTGGNGETGHTHEFGEWQPFNGSLPTCTESAWEIRTCSCGEMERREVPALGHLDKDGDGKCDRCGENLGGEHTHEWGEWQTKTRPTCTEAGTEMRVCACGEVETREVPALGHLDKDGDGKCDRCGESMGGEDPQTDLPCTVEALGADGSVLTADVQNLSEADKAAALNMIRKSYDLDEDAAIYAVDISVKNAVAGVAVRVIVKLKAPALSLDRYVVYHIYNGAVEKIEPTVSGENLVFMVSSFSPFIIGPKHLHQPGTLIEQTPATCEKDGVSYIECIKCHEKLETKTIPALGHIDENGDGKCDRCGENLGGEHTHEWGEWQTKTRPTCTEAGTEMRVCACGEVETREVPALGHIDENGDGKCDRCGKNLKEGGEIHEHAFGEWMTKKEATCTEAGMEMRVCACGEVETREVPALGHIDENGDGKCDRCGKNLKESGEHTHEFGEWMPMNGTLPTCTTGALEMRICSCGEVETREVPALGHIDENGDGKCDRCGKDMDNGNDQTSYPADAIAAYLNGTKDVFIDLDNDAVFGYELYTNEADNPTALRLVGKMPLDADAHAVVAGFQNAFADAGYKWGGFATHLGNEEDETLYHHAWISPDQEIAVMFAAFNQGEHTFGNIAYYSVSIVNLTAIADNNKAIMTSLGAAGYSPSVKLGGTYTFNGGITYLYTNVGTGLEGGGMYTYDYALLDIGTIDTSIPGEQTLRISLKGNADIYTDVTVLVWALTSIDVTTNKTKIDGRVAYYSTNWKYESEYTVTRHYSDGTTTTVKGNDESVEFGDIDGSKVKQDLTVSCTVDGVTVSTTVAIGLFKSVNYTCTNDGDIGADNAQFAIYAVGGAYGDGAWVALSYVELRRMTFAGNVYMDAAGFYFVRLSPDLDVFGNEVYDLGSEGVWNVSAYIELSDGSGSGTFAFLG